jgi:hypothetical protein
MKKIFIIFSLLFLGCKDDDPKRWVLPPQWALKFGFKNDLILKKICGDSNLIFDDSLFSYSINGKEKFFKGWISKNLQNDSFPFVVSEVADIVFLSANDHITTFYLHLPMQKVDTLYSEYERDWEGPNSCSCSMPLKELKLNGKSYIRKTDYDINGIYIFDR